MLRALYVPAVLLAIAGRALADDLETCRDRQADAKLRLTACENQITAGRLTGKDLASALFLCGNALMTKRDNDKAIAAFGAAHDADPDNVAYLNSRGIAYERKGDDDHAMADYNLALQMRPNYGSAFNNRGTLHLRKRALQSALDDFNAALKYSPNMYIAHINRARVLTINREFEAALADFAEAQRIDPAAPQTASYRSMTYVAMGRFDEAIADCNGLIEKVARNQFAMTNRADAYFARGDLAAALKDYNFVLGLNPNNVRAYAGRGRLFERRGDLAQARADYRSASFTLTPFDEIDTAVARSSARERLAALAPRGPAQSAARRVALLIGNGAYKNVHQLSNPARDAKLIADTLRGIGFQTVTLANDLTRDKFFEALHAFAHEAEKADWAVVYYAGHGLEIGGVNYLVPVDARFASDRDAETEAVALEQPFTYGSPPGREDFYFVAGK